MKRCLSVLVLSSATLLSACHQDALKSEPQDKTIAFLIEASAKAGKKLKIDYKPSHAYSFCMSGNPTHLNCDALFKEIVAIAEKTPNFKGLTEKALTNPSSFKAMKEPMDIKLFNTLDDDEDI